MGWFVHGKMAACQKYVASEAVDKLVVTGLK